MRFITIPLVILLILAIVSCGSVDAHRKRNRWRNEENGDVSGSSQLSADANDIKLPDKELRIWTLLHKFQTTTTTTTTTAAPTAPPSYGPPPPPTARSAGNVDFTDCDEDVISKRCAFDDDHNDDDDDFDDDEEAQLLYSDFNFSPNRRSSAKQKNLRKKYKRIERIIVKEENKS